MHFHDTYFVVAHFHYVMMGGTVIGLLGGLHHWWPKMFGRLYSEFWGKLTFLVIFVGFNITFFNQFILGYKGMPRRYYNYENIYTTQHVLSSIGAYILGFGFLMMFAYLMHSLFRGKKAPENPWGGATLEWACPSPPPHHNFDEPPQVGDPYDYSGIEYVPETDEYVKRPPGEPAP